MLSRSWTFGTWIKTTSDAPAGQTIIYLGCARTAECVLRVSIWLADGEMGDLAELRKPRRACVAQPGVIRLHTRAVDGSYRVSSHAAWLSDWHHLAVVHAFGELTVYWNSVRVGGSAWLSGCLGLQHAPRLLLGDAPEGTGASSGEAQNPFEGLMVASCLWERALAESEVLASKNRCCSPDASDAFSLRISRATSHFDLASDEWTVVVGSWPTSTAGIGDVFCHDTVEAYDASRLGGNEATLMAKPRPFAVPSLDLASMATKLGSPSSTRKRRGPDGDFLATPKSGKRSQSGRKKVTFDVERSQSENAHRHHSARSSVVSPAAGVEGAHPTSALRSRSWSPVRQPSWSPSPSQSVSPTLCPSQGGSQSSSQSSSRSPSLSQSPCRA